MSVLALPISNYEKEQRGVVKGRFPTIALALLGLSVPILRNHLRNDHGRKGLWSDHREMPINLFLFKVSA